MTVGICWWYPCLDCWTPMCWFFRAKFVFSISINWSGRKITCTFLAGNFKGRGLLVWHRPKPSRHCGETFQHVGWTSTSIPHQTSVTEPKTIVTHICSQLDHSLRLSNRIILMSSHVFFPILIKLWKIREDIPSGKRLHNHHNYGKIHHFQRVNPLCLWPCSIALLT